MTLHTVVRLAALGLIGVVGLAMVGSLARSRTETAPLASVAVPTSPVAALRAQPFVKTLSMATFFKESLDECVDFQIRIEPPDGAAPDWQPRDPPDIRKALDKDTDKLELRKPCAEQFSDRQVLATCEVNTEKDGKSFRMTAAYYNFATVGTDDDYMRDCLKAGGDWKAISRDSPEFRRARLGATAKELKGLTDKL